MIYILGWMVCGVIAAIIASNKRESAVVGFLIGAIFGPLGILLAFLSKGKTKECPHCKSNIHPDATACPNCGRDTVIPNAPETVAPDEDPTMSRLRENFRKPDNT